MELVKPIKVEQNTAQAYSLQSLRIQSTDDIDADVYLAKIGNTNKFSRSNISVWTGAAKSRKTFAMTMWGSSLLGGVDLYGQFYSYNKNRVLWFDTEQSPYDVQKVVRRVNKMAGTEEKLFMYGLRPLTPEERVNMIEAALSEAKCDVLVIDGARDLINDFNNAEQSTYIVTRLMKWSYDYNIHVAVVVHSSAKGVRGHLGTELENKSETIIKIEVNEDDRERSDIIEVKGRGKGFQNIGFKVNAEGLPEVLEQDQMTSFTSIPSSTDKDDIPF